MTRRVLLVYAFAGALACGSSKSPTYTNMGGNGCIPTATQICMANYQFSPANLTIPHGTMVTWMNGDTRDHTVANASSSSEVLASGFIAAGGTFSHSFATPGTFAYYCGIHGADGNPPTGMHGTITVN